MRPGSARVALLAVLQAGVVGTFDAIAHQAGIPAHQARTTLWNLRREGHICAHPMPADASAGAGRPRVAYEVAQSRPDALPFDSLAFARHAWRQAPAQPF